MGVVGDDRDLPAQPGAGLDAELRSVIASRPAVTCSPEATTTSYSSRVVHRGRARRHSTSSLVLPAIAETTTATSWPASTSRHEPRDAADALEVGHRGAAEFHHEPAHDDWCIP